MSDSLLSIQDLKTYFQTSQGVVRAVDSVSLDVKEGEIVGLVGESGCGKSVTAFSILRLVSEPGKIVGGKILYKGRDLLALDEKGIRKIRGKEIAMIFQEPMTSLNPVFTVGNQIAEAVRLHQKKGRKEAWKEAIRMLGVVSISSPEKRVYDYPHQMSGGMRQRVMIAMALSCRPSLLIADEPTTALDVTIQDQILTLLKKLQGEFKLSILLITHDFGIVAETVDRVAVMYAGKIVEEAPVKSIFKEPKHPYTMGLLNSIPGVERGGSRKRLPTIGGSVPDLLNLPEGCTFAPRCPSVMERCMKKYPEMVSLDGYRSVSCYLYIR
ncbi:MAG: ABC transporter ATP-binding protein [Acidobacteriota bacterium]